MRLNIMREVLTVVFFLHLITAVQYNRAIKIKANSMKIAKQLSRNFNKEQAQPSTKAHTPTLSSRTRKTSLTSRRQDSALPKLHLFVRHAKSGPWSYFKEISADGDLCDIIESIRDSGGLQAEILRGTLECLLSRRYFGCDMTVFQSDTSCEDMEKVLENAKTCRDILVNKVKKTIPAFRKIHPQVIQFGYRLDNETEPIYRFDSVNHNLQMRKMGDFYWDSGVSLMKIDEESFPLSAINIDEILRNPSNISEYHKQHLDLSSYVRLKKAVNDFAEQIKALPQSPTYLDLNSKLMGPELNVMSKEPLDPPDVLPLDIYVCSDGSAHLREGEECIRSSAGVYAVHVSAASEVVSLSLHVSDVAGFVVSPFDAELAGSLAASVLSREIVASLDSPCRITFLTDSKTLTRSLRMGPTSNQFTERSSSSRLAVWDLIMDHVETLTELKNEVNVRWIPGHPERRHAGVHDWTYFDGIIFMADKIAASELKSSDKEEDFNDIFRALGRNEATSNYDNVTHRIRFHELLVKDI